MEVASVLNRLRETNSSNEKKEILIETKSPLFEKLFNYSYNHFITFGVSKLNLNDITYTQHSPEDDWWNETFELLDKLAARTLTGNAARDAVIAQMSKVSEEDAAVLPHILKKDLRIGVNVGLLNKVYKGLLPAEFCMSANKYESKRVTFPVWADSKLDGVRCIAYFNGDSVTLFSRNGREFKNYTTIENELMLLNLPAGSKLDGEITMGHFQELMRTISRKDEGIELSKEAVYNIFDIPKENVPFKERMMILETLMEKARILGLDHLKKVEGNWFETETELLSFYESQLNDGFEGIMVKTVDGLYEHSRGWGWQKMKPEHTDDLEIVGLEEGRGKYEGQLGAFVCRLDNGDTVNVGSGLEDDERIEMWPKRDELIGQFIEVKYQEKTQDGSLRFPIFKRFRPDK